MSQIDRRTFIALSAAGAAVGLAGRAAQEVWFHRGVPVTVRRKGRHIMMEFEMGGKKYGLGTIKTERRPDVERFLRRSVEHTIDVKSGHAERWLAAQKERFWRMVV